MAHYSKSMKKLFAKVEKADKPKAIEKAKPERAARKPVLTYYFRGEIERGTGKGYKWHEGYSENTEEGRPVYPWMTKKEARAEAAAAGARAVFVDERRGGAVKPKTVAPKPNRYPINPEAEAARQYMRDYGWSHSEIGSTSNRDIIIEANRQRSKSAKSQEAPGKPGAKQAKLTLTEILADLPRHVDWKIVNSSHATLRTPYERGEVYWDESDPASPGWAYRFMIYSREPDEHGVRHAVREESGSIDTPKHLSDWFRSAPAKPKAKRKPVSKPKAPAKLAPHRFGKADHEIIAWALARAEEAGVHSVKKVSGPDVLRLCALAKAPSNKTVRWCRQRAEAAGDGSVQQISGVDLAALVGLAKAGQAAAKPAKPGVKAKPKRTPKKKAPTKKPEAGKPAKKKLARAEPSPAKPKPKPLLKSAKKTKAVGKAKAKAPKKSAKKKGKR